MKKNNPIQKRKHFLLLGIIPSILFLIIVILSLSWSQKIHLSNTVQSDLNAVYHMFYGELYEEAKLINALADQLAEKKEIQDAFMGKDRARLLEIARPIFQKIRAHYEITQCYFHSLDRTNFLRVYEPEQFGDIIDRFTLKQAVQTGAVSYGLEFGSLETLTLRVVLPWWVKGQLVGYIELGKEIDHITAELKKILDIDLLLVVNKSLVNKELWEKGAKRRGNIGSWNQFSDSVVIDTTLPEIPPILSKDLAQPHHQHKDLLLDINISGRQYLAGFAPLLDASDTDIGEIIIIKDFTDLKSIETRLTVLLLTGYLFCLLLYMIFIFVYLRRLKRKLSFLLGSSISSV